MVRGGLAPLTIPSLEQELGPYLWEVGFQNGLTQVGCGTLVPPGGGMGSLCWLALAEAGTWTLLVVCGVPVPLVRAMGGISGPPSGEGQVCHVSQCKTDQNSGPSQKGAVSKQQLAGVEGRIPGHPGGGRVNTPTSQGWGWDPGISQHKAGLSFQQARAGAGSWVLLSGLESLHHLP